MSCSRLWQRLYSFFSSKWRISLLLLVFQIIFLLIYYLYSASLSARSSIFSHPLSQFLPPPIKSFTFHRRLKTPAHTRDVTPAASDDVNEFDATKFDNTDDVTDDVNEFDVSKVDVIEFQSKRENVALKFNDSRSSKNDLNPLTKKKNISSFNENGVQPPRKKSPRVDTKFIQLNSNRVNQTDVNNPRDKNNNDTNFTVNNDNLNILNVNNAHLNDANLNSANENSIKVNDNSNSAKLVRTSASLPVQSSHPSSIRSSTHSSFRPSSSLRPSFRPSFATDLPSFLQPNVWSKVRGEWRIEKKLLLWLKIQSEIPLWSIPLETDRGHYDHRDKTNKSNNGNHGDHSNDVASSLRSSSGKWPVAGGVCSASAAADIRNASTLFRTAFRPDVPLFLARDDILNDNVFQKLSLYPPPFGLKVKGKSDVFHYLAKTKLFSSQHFFPLPLRLADKNCISCAVVGGGGSLKGSRQGEFIDGHDLVFRVNIARVKGFEPDVGHRTDVYYSYPESLSKFARLDADAFPKDAGHIQKVFGLMEKFHPDRYLNLFSDRNHGGYDKMPGLKQVNNFFKPGTFRIQHPDFFRYINIYYLGTRKKPTSGFSLTILALHICDVVRIFGYSYGEGEFIHYYEKAKMVTKLKDHDIDIEYDVLRKLHKDGVLQWVK